MSREYVCKDCGYIGPIKSGKRGSFWVSTILWTIFFLPGLIYSIWRMMGRNSCTKCGSTSLAKLNSTYGQYILERTCLENITTNSNNVNKK